MKRILLFLILVPMWCFSQNQVTNPQNKIELSFGTEYRLTPLYLKGYDSYYFNEEPTVYCIEDMQISGTSIHYGLHRNLGKIKLRLGFGQSFRYDYIFTNTGILSTIPNNINKIEYGLITDYQFFIEKYWLLKDKELSLLAGYSLMNRGTQYSYSYLVGDINDPNSMIISVTNDFNFSGFNFGLGFKSNTLKYGLGCYFTDKHKYIQPSQLGIIYFKVDYILGLNKKKTEE
jgi:hypothetical protein